MKIEATSDGGTMKIEATSDGGKTWQPICHVPGECDIRFQSFDHIRVRAPADLESAPVDLESIAIGKCADVLHRVAAAQTSAVVRRILRHLLERFTEPPTREELRKSGAFRDQFASMQGQGVAQAAAQQMGLGPYKEESQ